MAIYHREDKYLNLLSDRSYTVKELSEQLFISEPTVRRDLLALKEKGLITSVRGIVSLNSNHADDRIPLFVRDLKNHDAKEDIAQKALNYVKDGDTIMLDASTTAYHLVSHLSCFPHILVITNGVKTALHSASMGLKTICIGGEIDTESLSYTGTNAKRSLRQYNADLAFFSCRGISEDGRITDTSVSENSIRQIMIQNAKKKYLLCDQSKFGKVYLHTLCSQDELDAIITD